MVGLDCVERLVGIVSSLSHEIAIPAHRLGPKSSERLLTVDWLNNILIALEPRPKDV